MSTARSSAIGSVATKNLARRWYRGPQKCGAYGPKHPNPALAVVYVTREYVLIFSQYRPFGQSILLACCI